MNLLWKLLKKHISIAQLSGFFLSNLIGTIIVLLTIQLCFDTRPLFNSKDNFMKSDYIILSKKLSSVTTLLGKNPTFSKKEIKELEDAPFSSSIGKFISSQFKVYVSLTMPQSNQKIASDIFFESVPDRYIDVNTDKWHFDTTDRVIPIIMPRNYLNLYNFGFSQSRNLPKLSEGAISLINLDVFIQGSGKNENFKANIIGFSDKLNTILVPQDFIIWANSQFAEEHSSSAPTRLILEANNPNDQSIATFFAKRNYTAENNKLDGSKITHLMRIMIYSLLAIGVFISLLSLYILMLSIFLLVEKNSTKLQNLLLLGYSTKEVSRPYKILTALINIAILLISITSVSIIRGYYLDTIDTLFPQGEISTMSPTILIGTLLILTVTAFNCYMIQKKVKMIFKQVS